MQWISDNIWLILFVAWGMPLGTFRSRFRKLVYGTDDWTINIKPYFVKETKALLGLTHMEDPGFIQARNRYRFYLLVYLALFVAYRYW